MALMKNFPLINLRSITAMSLLKTLFTNGDPPLSNGLNESSDSPKLAL